MKKLKNLKTTTKYLLLFIFSIILVLSIHIGAVHAFSIKTGADILSPFALLYIIMAVPFLLSLYGIFSFIFAKRVIIPNVFLFISGFVYTLIIKVVDHNFEFVNIPDIIRESLPLPTILTAISLIFSFISWLIYRGCKK